MTDTESRINKHIDEVDKYMEPIFTKYSNELHIHFFKDLSNVILEYAMYEKCAGDRIYGYKLFGEYEGLQIEWYQTGNKLIECEYKNGKGNGRWIEWYRNEQNTPT